MKSVFKLIITIFLLWTVVCGLSTTSYAEIPKLINYQGRLTDSQNRPITGTANVTFKIYESEAGGTALWTETYTSLTLDKGIFNVMLGGVTPLNLAFDRPYFLGIQIGSDAEMTPRQRMTSVGYAIRAENADNANSLTTVVPITNGGTGQTTANSSLNALLPTQSGNSGKFLSTNGSTVMWAENAPTNYVAGDTLLISADTERSFTLTSYVKVKEIRVARGGVLRIKFDLNAGGSPQTVKGRIYRNGVPVGIEQTAGDGYQTFSEDVPGWSSGDLCQLYVQNTYAAHTAYTRNFRLYITAPITETIMLN